MVINCYRPEILQEALKLKEEFPKKLVISGGTDLMVRLREMDPEEEIELLSLEGLGELKEIFWGENEIKLGSGVKIETITWDEEISRNFPALKEAAAQLGSWQVRNLATLGGNICNAAPSGDLLPPLITYGATFELKTLEGGRELPAEEFFLGPGKVDLAENELLTGIRMPLPEQNSGSAYVKFGIRGAMEIAIVGVSARVLFGNDGNLKDARLCLGAVAPTPLRVPEGEKTAIGTGLENKVIKKVAQIARETCRPISDIRSSKEFREDIVGILVEQALNLARERALKKGCN